MGREVVVSSNMSSAFGDGHFFGYWAAPRRRYALNIQWADILGCSSAGVCPAPTPNFQCSHGLPALVATALPTPRLAESFRPNRGSGRSVLCLQGMCLLMLLTTYTPSASPVQTWTRETREPVLVNTELIGTTQIRPQIDMRESGPDAISHRSLLLQKASRSFLLELF